MAAWLSVRKGDAMRTTDDQASVRLYYLHPEAGTTETLLYGTMAEAVALAERQDETVQDGLYLQTNNDVVAYLDFAEG